MPYPPVNASAIDSYDARMSDAIDEPPQHAAATHAGLCSDVPCVGCGYNLRTRVATEACPECGTAVHQSLRPNWLLFADLAWLRSYRIGTNWVVAGMVLSLVGVRFGGSFLDSVLHMAQGIVAAACLTRGLWPITAAPPAPVPPDYASASRRARLCLILTAPMLIAWSASSPWLDETTADRCGVLVTLTKMPLIVTLSLLLQRFDPTGSMRIARLSSYTAAAWVLAFTSVAVLSTAQSMFAPVTQASSNRLNDLPLPLQIFVVINLLVLAACFIAALVIFRRVRRELRTALDPAQRAHAELIERGVLGVSRPAQQRGDA